MKLTRLRWKNPLFSGEAGTSLVGIMVSISLLSIFAVIAGQSFRHLNSSARQAQSTAAVRDIEHVVIQAISQRYKDYVLLDRCTSEPTTYFSNINLGGLGEASMNPPKFFDPKGRTAEPPSLAAKDLNRCTKTPFSKARQRPYSTSFYICLNLDTRTAVGATQASAGTFAANRGAFIEFFVNIRDLRTDAFVPCRAIAGKGFGLESYYYIHWTTNDPSRIIYDSKMGTLNAAL